MKIYDGAFSDCKLLDEITIPINVTKINNNVFRDCSALRFINILAPYFCSNNEPKNPVPGHSDFPYH